MDITVTIPNGKVDNIVTAIEARPDVGDLDIPEDADAAAIRAAVAAFYAAKWKDEVRTLLRQHRRQVAINAIVDADQALPDPLA